VMWTRVGLVIASRTEATRVPSRKAGFIAGLSFAIKQRMRFQKLA
jgi:hypothetical protein